MATRYLHFFNALPLCFKEGHQGAALSSALLFMACNAGQCRENSDALVKQVSCQHSGMCPHADRACTQGAAYDKPMPSARHPKSDVNTRHTGQGLQRNLLCSPAQADLSTMPREMPTSLGPDEIVLLRAGGEAGRLKKPTTAIVTPLTDNYSPPARVLWSLETCQVLTL